MVIFLYSDPTCILYGDLIIINYETSNHNLILGIKIQTCASSFLNNTVFKAMSEFLNPHYHVLITIKFNLQSLTEVAAAGVVASGAAEAVEAAAVVSAGAAAVSMVAAGAVAAASINAAAGEDSEAEVVVSLSLIVDTGILMM